MFFVKSKLKVFTLYLGLVLLLSSCFYTFIQDLWATWILISYTDVISCMMYFDIFK